MPCRIRVVPEAEREIRRLPGHMRQRFIRQVEALKAEPRPPVAKPLGEPYTTEFYKIRFADYRLVYRVDDELGIVRVLRAGLKEGPEFYEGLPE